MKFSGFLPRLNESDFSKAQTAVEADKQTEVAFDPDLLNVDMFCQLAYLSAISTANLPRHKLFEYAGSMPYTSARYFKKVHNMAQQLNYDYTEACLLVGLSTKEPGPKGVLLRLSGSLASGENEGKFLLREAEVTGKTYGDEYERKVEAMKKWTEAYTALMLSASLIIVVSLVSQLIFPVPQSFVMGMLALVFMATLFGVWVLFRAAPKEIKTHSMASTSVWHARASAMARFLLPSAAVVPLVLLAAGAPLGVTLIIVSAIIFPVGAAIVWDDRLIDRHDDDIAGFLRSLGGVATAIGSTVTEALGRLDFNSVRSLKKPVDRLNSALHFGVNPNLCWDRFVGDTGSECIKRAVKIFWDSVSLGGDPQTAGNQGSMFAVEVSSLRAKRKAVSSGFSYLCLLMHVTVCALMIGIYEVLRNFSMAAQSMGNISADGAEALAQLPTFQLMLNSGSLDKTLGTVVTAIVLLFVVANPIAVKVVDGGHNFKYLFYLSIIMASSGAVMVIAPGLVSGVFGSLTMGAPQ
jgi:archaeal flagellar protein FlaJ